jgi:adenosylcobinamide kinase/adenosylcobinamide-phosphate guanylyltransferase
VTGSKTLVLGGARSGKSTFAEALVAGSSAVRYLATSADDGTDAEWSARVASHRARRPASWTTIEVADPQSLPPLISQAEADGSVLLVDCLTLWLARAMDAAAIWPAPAPGADALAALTHTVDALVAAWTSSAARVVAVSNEVGGGVVPEHRSGRLFRDELGALNVRLAATADDVVVVTAGLPRFLKRNGRATEVW